MQLRRLGRLCAAGNTMLLNVLLSRGEGKSDFWERGVVDQGQRGQLLQEGSPGS